MGFLSAPYSIADLSMEKNCINFGNGIADAEIHSVKLNQQAAERNAEKQAASLFD